MTTHFNPDNAPAASFDERVDALTEGILIEVASETPYVAVDALAEELATALAVISDLTYGFNDILDVVETGNLSLSDALAQSMAQRLPSQTHDYLYEMFVAE